MKLYRKMLEDADGLPLVGDGPSMLGVRPADPAFPKKRGADVGAVYGTDAVKSGEGMSAFDSPASILPQIQGIMWEIETDDLPAELVSVQRGRRRDHYQMEPTREMTLDDLQALLASTRDLWQRV